MKTNSIYKGQRSYYNVDGGVNCRDMFSIEKLTFLCLRDCGRPKSPSGVVQFRRGRPLSIFDPVEKEGSTCIKIRM